MKETVKPKLSICIPTYNFGRFIGQTLDSIIANLAHGVEVVILDGGSTDNTDIVVEEKQKTAPQIVYHRQGYKGGIDRDIVKVITLAQGEYCWLFSADDIMMAGAVEKILGSIKTNCDVYLCEQTLCDFEMQNQKGYPVFDHITSSEIFDLGNKEQRQRYFSHARTSEAFFSFLAGPIFKKSVWEKASGVPDSFYDTCWGLAGRLLSRIPDGLKVHYIGESLLYKRGINRRGDNNSFKELGVVKLFMISVEGFSHIAETIFGKGSQEAFHIQRVIRNEWPLRTVIYMKTLTALYPQQESYAILKELAAKHYYSSGFGNKLRYLLFRIIPLSLLRLAYMLFKRRFSGNVIKCVKLL
jgi:abequosyltransferase